MITLGLCLAVSQVSAQQMPTSLRDDMDTQTGSDQAWKKVSAQISQGLACQDKINMKDPAVAKVFEFVSESNGLKNYRAIPPKDFTVLGAPVLEISLNITPDSNGIYSFITKTPEDQIWDAVTKRHLQEQKNGAQISDFCGDWMCTLTIMPVENSTSLNRVECSSTGED